jgi:hypothetical protein
MHPSRPLPHAKSHSSSPQTRTRVIAACAAGGQARLGPPPVLPGLGAPAPALPTSGTHLGPHAPPPEAS